MKGWGDGAAPTCEGWGCNPCQETEAGRRREGWGGPTLVNKGGGGATLSRAAAFDYACAPLTIATTVSDANPAWDAWKNLELNPEVLELRVVLGWAVCYAQVRAAWVCTHQRE